MPMNKYGEIIRNSSSPPPITPSNNNGNKSGIAIAIGVVLLIVVIVFIASASHNKKNTETRSKEKNNISNQAKEQNAETQTDNVVYVENAWLTDLDYIKSENITIESDSMGTANTGEEYSHYMYARSPYNEIVYNLNGNYDTLSALWAICEQDKDADSRNSIAIYADDEMVYESPVLTRGDLPESIEVDIKNCNVLTILFKEGTGCAELGNILLSNKSSREYNTETYDPPELPCWLTDLEYLTNDGVRICSDDTGVANTGEQYSHYMYANNEGSEIVYYLNGKYSSISGMWSICEQNKDTDDHSKFEIFADKELVYSSSSITGGDLPETFDANLNNCEKLKIKFVSGGGSGELANLRLYPGVKSEKKKSAVSKTSELKGIWLTDMDYLTNDGVHICSDDTGTTNTGETYSHYMFANEEGSEIIYYLKGNYNNVKGLWTICQYNRDTDDHNCFEIYADDKLVYESPSLTSGDIPVSFDVEINHCQKLTIRFTEGGGSGELGNISVY